MNSFSLPHRIYASYSAGRTLCNKSVCFAPAGSTTEVITSVTNAYVKHCVKLRENARYRSTCGTCLLVGASSILEAAGNKPLHAKVLMLPQQQQVEAKQRGDPSGNLEITAERTILVSESVMKKISGLGAVDNLDRVVEVQLPTVHTSIPPSWMKVTRLLALEGVQDPGNLGTLLRTAAAFGWQAVWLLPGCCDPFNDKAVRASKGATFKLPLAQGGWTQLQQVTSQHGLQLLAAEPEPPSAQQGNLGQLPSGAQAEGVCLVLGSEGQGLSQEALGRCIPVAIPMTPGMESLNVGIAGGILMFLLSSGAAQLQRRIADVPPPT